MSLTEDYLKEIMEGVAKHLKLTDWHYTKEKFEVIAQNHFGVLLPVTLEGNSKIISVVVKLAPTDERFRVSGALTLMFAREVFVYSILLSQYRELQTNLKLTKRLIVPECYYSRKEYCREALVLEDMRRHGYRPYVHEMFLDLQHIIVAIKTLANFHAMSFVIKEKDGYFYEEICKECLPLTNKTNKRFMDILMDRLVKAEQKLAGTKYAAIVETMQRQCIKLVESVAVAVERTTLCHGDIWKENLLFRYSNGQPSEACLIDFQTVRMSSPAYDVLYLIVSSTDTALRRHHFHTLLDVYYETLTARLSEAAVISNVYSRAAFQKDLETVAPACLIVANTALWLSCGLQQEGHVTSKKVLNSDEEKAAAVKKYTSIISAIIEDYFLYGYM